MTGTQVSAAGRVVVGVDGSDPSAQAARYGAECARRRGVGLLVVHVTPRQGAGEAVPMAPREVRERYDESATALVQAAADAVRAATGFSDVTAEVVDDYPVDGLLALSAEAALVVTGRRGTGGLPGLLLGSTAGALVQHAECPVIALPDELAPPADGTRSVVVGVEGGPADEPVLAFAVEEAAARGAVLTAVHAWQELTMASTVGGFGPLVDWSTVAAAEERLLRDSVAPWRGTGTGIEEQLVRDRPATALLDASTGAELLVVGHRHRGRLARLGSTTNGVLHRAPCPIAVVPVREQDGGR